MRTAVVAFLWIATMVFSPASAAVAFDQATKDYLEGVWLMGKEPKDGPCVHANYSDYQWEFEFRKSDGRALYYEPLDFFVPVAIADARREGDVLRMMFAVRGQKVPFVLRILSPDRMEEIDESSNGKIAGMSKTSIWYRCGAPDWMVNAAASSELLRILSTPGDPDVWFATGETCSREWDPLVRNGFLKFEVYGPVHYYVWGTIGDRSWHSRLDLSRIRSITQIDKSTLQLVILERTSSGVTGWAGERVLRPYVINVIWDGKRIFVPQMGKSFLRCSSDVPAVANH